MVEPQVKEKRFHFNWVWTILSVIISFNLITAIRAAYEHRISNWNVIKIWRKLLCKLWSTRFLLLGSLTQNRNNAVQEKWIELLFDSLAGNNSRMGIWVFAKETNISSFISSSFFMQSKSTKLFQSINYFSCHFINRHISFCGLSSE